LVGFALFLVYELFFIWQFEITQRPDNTFRDVWGITYNITNSFIIFIAIFALIVAYIQSNEARKSRIAQVFIQIESRWSSKDLETGKSIIQTILSEFVNTHLSSDSSRLAAAMNADDTMAFLQSFFDDRLSKMLAEKPDQYEYVTSLFDFFDYIGLLVTNGYLQMAEVSDMVGDTVLLTYDLTEAHLQRLIDRRRQFHLARNLPGVPVPYNFLFSFAASVRARFQQAPH
jgi:hypothetical protein